MDITDKYRGDKFFNKAREDYLDQKACDSHRLVNKQSFITRHWTPAISTDGVVRVDFREVEITPGVGFKVLKYTSYSYPPETLISYFLSHYSRFNSRFYFVHVLAQLNYNILKAKHSFRDACHSISADDDSPHYTTEAEKLAFFIALATMLEEVGKTHGYYDCHNPYNFDISKAMCTYASTATTPAF